VARVAPGSHAVHAMALARLVALKQGRAGCVGQDLRQPLRHMLNGPGFVNLLWMLVGIWMGLFLARALPSDVGEAGAVRGHSSLVDHALEAG